MPMLTGAYFYQDPLRSSVETILSRSGFRDLPPEEHAETVNALIVEVQRRIGRALSEIIDEHSLELFGELVKMKAPEEELSAFFSVHVPEYKKCIEETVENFGEECCRAAKELGSVRL